MILCESAHSGKSSAAMQKNFSASNKSNYTQKITSQTQTLPFNPLAIESENILFGYHTLAKGWKDRILTTILRKANRNRHTSWICFDGIISRAWSDLLPSILEKELS
ncbi:unnamed protein product [Rotaria sp. Silwood2]|nr:unnamed protein product [Rotaria sp. Silwood2]CAF4615866.1 unnamed protein product [Rotaria sp. Silwood2]